MMQVTAGSCETHGNREAQEGLCIVYVLLSLPISDPGGLSCGLQSVGVGSSGSSLQLQAKACLLIFSYKKNGIGIRHGTYLHICQFCGITHNV